MERKSIKKKRVESLLNEILNDEEQELWDSKVFGVSPQHVKKSSLYKPPARLISIRVPEDVLIILKTLAEKEGLKYQTYVVSLLKKHTKKKKGRLMRFYFET